MAQTRSGRPQRKMPWWLIVIVVLAIARVSSNYSRESSVTNRQTGSPTPVGSGSFRVMTSNQVGETEASNACGSAIDRTEHARSNADVLAYVKNNSTDILKVCGTAYEDAVKDADQDSGDAHFLDENNAAVAEEMVSATDGIARDKIGEKAASDKAVALAQDVIANSHAPQLIRSAKETVRELVGPVRPMKP